MAAKKIQIVTVTIGRRTLILDHDYPMTSPLVAFAISSPMADRNIGKPWSPHEDKLLTQAIAVHGEVDKWKIIALSVPGRTNKACRKVRCLWTWTTPP